jgi:hypothetical protein
MGRSVDSIREEFSLNQKEVHEYGQLLLEKIRMEYEGLIMDSDNCWGLDIDLERLKKLVTIVVRLQNGKKLKEEKKDGS